MVSEKPDFSNSISSVVIVLYYRFTFFNLPIRRQNVLKYFNFGSGTLFIYFIYIFLLNTISLSDKLNTCSYFSYGG